MNKTLLFLLGLFIPFPLLGWPISPPIFVGPSLILGVLFAASSILGRGLSRRGWYALFMIAAFWLTAVFRYASSDYILSLAALSLAIAPASVCTPRANEARSLYFGVLSGAVAAAAILLLEIFSQISGYDELYATITNTFPHGIRRSESYQLFNLGPLSYVRPAASFAEPAHLALYLVFVLICIDAFGKSGIWSIYARALFAACCILTGSASGVVVLLVYLAISFRYYLSNFFLSRFSSLSPTLAVLTVLFLVSGITLFYEQAFSLFDPVAKRLEVAVVSFQSGELIGSEASRINSYIALRDYWDQEGLFGLLFGTGYANSELWLISNYGHLSTFASFARGHVDSMFVAVMLSTGLVGAFFYALYVRTFFPQNGARSSLGIWWYIIATNLTFSVLVVSLPWMMFFCLHVLSVSQSGDDRSSMKRSRASSYPQK